MSVTKLFKLPVLGTGSCEIESLGSYLVRLADLHGVEAVGKAKKIAS